MRTMSSNHQLSGKRFIQIVQRDLEEINNGLGKLSLTELSTSSGLSARYLGQLAKSKTPNPTSMTIRLVLFTLGYSVDDADEDVVPFLKKKGCYQPSLHGVQRKRKELA